MRGGIDGLTRTRASLFGGSEGALRIGFPLQLDTGSDGPTVPSSDNNCSDDNGKLSGEVVRIALSPGRFALLQAEGTAF